MKQMQHLRTFAPHWVDTISERHRCRSAGPVARTERRTCSRRDEVLKKTVVTVRYLKI